MSMNTKEKKKYHRWNNPDFYIGLSFFFYFSLLLLLLASPFLMARFHVTLDILQMTMLLFLVAGALFSGIGNWIGFSHKPYPGNAEEPTEEVLQQLDDRLKKRREELSRQKNPPAS